MSKKKNKKKKQKDNNILFEVDMSLNSQYAGIKDELEYLQMEWDRARKKVKKKARKKAKTGQFYPYEEELKVRKQLVKQMEDSNLFERTEVCLSDFKPICLIIARLVAALIVAILSIDAIKFALKPETMKKMSRVYELAMSF